MVCGGIIAPLVMPDVVIDRLLYTFKKDSDVGILGEFSLSELEQMYRTQEFSVDTSTQARFDSMENALKDFQKHHEYPWQFHFIYLELSSGPIL